MYNYFKGKLIEKEKEHIVLDVNGIGYEFLCPLSTTNVLDDIGNEVTLYSYLHVREDILRLYGFVSKQEKELFIVLISVSGLGPKVALSILSNISTQEFKYAILEGNITLITKIPGIGKKTAERIILELKSKIEKMDLLSRHAELTPTIFSTTPLAGSIENDVIAALTALGYKQNEAKKAFEKFAGNTDIKDMALDEIITRCLG